MKGLRDHGTFCQICPSRCRLFGLLGSCSGNAPWTPTLHNARNALQRTLGLGHSTEAVAGTAESMGRQLATPGC